MFRFRLDIAGEVQMDRGIARFADGVSDYRPLWVKGGFTMLLLILILLIVFGGGFGFYGSNRWGPGPGWGGGIGLILLIFLVLYLLGYLHR